VPAQAKGYEGPEHITAEDMRFQISPLSTFAKPSSHQRWLGVPPAKKRPGRSYYLPRLIFSASAATSPKTRAITSPGLVRKTSRIAATY